MRGAEPIAKAAAYGLLALLMAAYGSYTFQKFAFIPYFVSDEVYYAAASYNLLEAFGAAPPRPPGAYYPQWLAGYLNLEHPPLAKYLIALSIYALGYRPYAWRLPSWIIGEAALAAAFLLGRELTKRWGLAQYAGGLAAAAALAADPNFWVLHGIALLDPYAGFFGLLALYLALRAGGRGGAGPLAFLPSTIALSLAIASKEIAAPLLIPYAVYVRRSAGGWGAALALALAVPAALYLALSAPLMAHLGLAEWLEGGLLHTARWDIQSGHVPEYALGQMSTPWDWLLDVHSFYMGLGLYASTSPPLLLAWLAMAAYAFLARNAALSTAASFPLAVWLALLAVYALGNHTLISFYVSSFSPMSDAFAGAALVDLILRRRSERAAGLRPTFQSAASA